MKNSEPYADNQYSSCQCNHPSLNLHEKKIAKPECREGELQQACSVYRHVHPIFFLASKTYIGSVLFRASAFTGAKFASGVPEVIGRFGS